MVIWEISKIQLFDFCMFFILIISFPMKTDFTCRIDAKSQNVLRKFYYILVLKTTPPQESILNPLQRINFRGTGSAEILFNNKFIGVRIFLVDFLFVVLLFIIFVLNRFKKFLLLMMIWNEMNF